MEWYEALILGIIQGLTEFLPISSSGHLEIASFILNTKQSQNLLFTVLVHIATAISIIYVFRGDILKIIKGVFTFNKKEIDIALKIIVSSIPVGIIGILFEDRVESFFNGNIILVGSMLLVTSILLFFTYFSREEKGRKITFIDALIIGIAQAFAILPGISRSGATISTAIFLRINRQEATKFSFLMVLIPIFGILLLKIIDGLSSEDIVVANLISFPYAVGFLSALFSGVIACKLMLKIVKESKLIYFSAYCLFVGLISILYGCNNLKESTFYIEPVKEIHELRKISVNSPTPRLDSIGSHLELVDLKKLNDNFKLDIRYASENNFMRSKFYNLSKAYLNKDAAKNLLKAQKDLEEKGFGIVIFDAYRPWYVTKMFWEGTPKHLKHFVADPTDGSVHNRGCAIDIGLYDKKSGKNIKMISGYDEFTERAYPDYNGGEKEKRDIRDLLISTMERNGFSVYEFEWWHYNYNMCNSGIMNYSFEELDSITSI
ncbi:MAG: undecaprenyl-diphosphate phosphatase [Cytophagales bacterium]